MRRRASRIAAALAVVAIIAGALIGGPPALAGAQQKVGINHFAYHPPTLRVGVGTKVVFANESGITHTATGRGFDTGGIAAGRSVAVRFAHKGTFAYHCKIHPFMKGKIVVH